MNNLGIICILKSLPILLFSIFKNSFLICKKDDRAIEVGRYTLLAKFFVVLLAFIVLMTQLARMDLTNHYVVMHSSDHLPLFYRITSIWSGSSGSLLFWNLLVSLFTMPLTRRLSPSYLSGWMASSLASRSTKDVSLDEKNAIANKETAIASINIVNFVFIVS